MRRRLTHGGVALLALALTALAAAAPAEAAPRRKAPAKTVAAAPIVPLPITCGPPLVAPKVEKAALSDRLKGAVKAQKGPAKLPDACVLSRFQDPGYPTAEPTSPGLPLAAFLGGAGPMPAAWPAYGAALQALADQIAIAGPRPDVRAKVVIVADRMEDARGFFAGPGSSDGVIVVTTGLLERLYGEAKAGAPTQEALRFMLAHAYAHLVLKHPQTLTRPAGAYDQMAQALQLASVGISVVQNFGGDGAAAGTDEARARTSASVILAAGFVSDLEAGEPARFRFPEFADATERDADLLASDILVRKGADPGVGVKGLKAAWDANAAGLQAAAQLKAQAARASAAAAQDIASLRASLFQVKNAPFLMQKAQLMAASYAAHFALAKVEERRQMGAVHLHDDAEARIAAVGAYLDAFYPDRAAAVAQTDAGRAPLPAVDFARVQAEVEGDQAAERAEGDLARGDVAGAGAEIDAALKSPVAGNADVLLIAAAVAIAEGKPELASRRLKTVAAGGYRGPLVYQKLAVADRVAGDDNAALVALSDGAAALGDAKPFIVDRIAIFKARGDAEGVQGAIRDCTALGDMTLTVACQRAADADDKGKPGATVAGGAPPSSTKDKVMGAAGNLAAAALATAAAAPTPPPRAAMARVDGPLPPAEPPPAPPPRAKKAR